MASCHTKRKIFLQTFFQQKKKPIESIYVELNRRNKKYLRNCFDKAHKAMITNHLATLSKFLDLSSSRYKKKLILGYFNVEIDASCVKCLCETYNLTNLINKPTCYKNPNNPTCIDMIVTKVLRTF